MSRMAMMRSLRSSISRSSKLILSSIRCCWLISGVFCIWLFGSYRARSVTLQINDKVDLESLKVDPFGRQSQIAGSHFLRSAGWSSSHAAVGRLQEVVEVLATCVQQLLGSLSCFPLDTSAVTLWIGPVSAKFGSKVEESRTLTDRIPKS